MRTVLFDVDGVLVHGYHTRPETRCRWDENLQADLGISPEAFSAQFINGVFVKEVLIGRMSLVNALESTLPSLGYNGSPMTVISYWMERDSKLNHPLIDLVRRLRQSGKVRLGVATNQEHIRAFHLWNGLGLKTVFDDMFNSARLGAMKPDRRFFERLSQLIGAQDERPLMFDDSPAVVAAATEFGWEGVLFDGIEDCSDHPWIRRQIDG